VTCGEDYSVIVGMEDRGGVDLSIVRIVIDDEDRGQQGFGRGGTSPEFGFKKYQSPMPMSTRSAAESRKNRESGPRYLV
jgi:hypothetical protein